MTYRILVTEDDEPIRKLVSTVLTRRGYAVDVAENGAVAIRRIEAATYDAIILDVMMPLMNGLQVLEWLARISSISFKKEVCACRDHRTLASLSFVEVLFMLSGRTSTLY